MNDVALFYLLKQKILVKYREDFPYYSGDIHSFGNREIAQLIDFIEKDGHGRVSEKWVYTHLKPVLNEKLPRRDMLDIFCRWLGYGDWNEFIYVHKDATAPVQETPEEPALIRKSKKITYSIMGIAAIVVVAIIGLTANGGGEVPVCLKDKYTQKEIGAERVTLHLLKDGSRHKLKKDGNCYLLGDTAKETLLIVESPYYRTDTLKIPANATHAEFDLQPDDYAMMLRAYMNGKASDWEKRRKQLGELLSDEAVIEEVMFDDIGVEFLNKQEFINKVTLPTKIARGMEIIEIEYKEDKIVSLKYMQKEK